MYLKQHKDKAQQVCLLPTSALLRVLLMQRFICFRGIVKEEYFVIILASQKFAFMMLTPLNPTFM